MSIFSGLSPENLRVVYEAAKHSPEALIVLAIVAFAAVLLLGVGALMAVRGVAGFYAHVQNEEEEQRLREEEEERLQKETRKERGSN